MTWHDKDLQWGSTKAVPCLGLGYEAQRFIVRLRWRTTWPQHQVDMTYSCSLQTVPGYPSNHGLAGTATAAVILKYEDSLVSPTPPRASPTPFKPHLSSEAKKRQHHALS
jgi:hypothetical protein